MPLDFQIKVAPSILSADFVRLGSQVAEAVDGGADMLHIDIMDGHFVPNITFGPLIVKAVRSVTSIPLDVHLMVEDPDRIIPALVEAGADMLTVHAEACVDLHRVVHEIKGTGLRVGVALNPATPLSAVEHVLPYLDLVLAMTVNPGLPGQAFLPGVLPKIAQLRQLLDVGGLSAELEVDGGIARDTARRVVEVGARVLVAGSAIFTNQEGIPHAINTIRREAERSS